jgi:hypothetical protein
MDAIGEPARERLHRLAGWHGDGHLSGREAVLCEARLDGLPDIALYVRKRQVDNDLTRTYPYIVSGAFTDLWVVVCIRDLPQVRPVLEEFVALQKLLSA